MKKLNSKIIFLSFIITSILLFGGWFGAQFFGQEKPIRDWISEQEGLELKDLKIEQDAIFVELSFHNGESFGLSYIQLVKELNQLAKGKEIRIGIDTEQSEYHPWWLAHSAPVIEALKNDQYPLIEQIIMDWKAAGLLREGKSMMNSHYVLLYLEPSEGDEIYLSFTLQQGKGEAE